MGVRSAAAVLGAAALAIMLIGALGAAAVLGAAALAIMLIGVLGAAVRALLAA